MAQGNLPKTIYPAMPKQPKANPVAQCSQQSVHCNKADHKQQKLPSLLRFKSKCLKDQPANQYHNNSGQNQSQHIQKVIQHLPYLLPFYKDTKKTSFLQEGGFSS